MTDEGVGFGVRPEASKNMGVDRDAEECIGIRLYTYINVYTYMYIHIHMCIGFTVAFRVQGFQRN